MCYEWMKILTGWLDEAAEQSSGVLADDQSVTCSHQLSHSAAAPLEAQGGSDTPDLPELFLAGSEPAPRRCGAEGHDEDEDEAAWLWVTACRVQWSGVLWLR